VRAGRPLDDGLRARAVIWPPIERQQTLDPTHAVAAARRPRRAARPDALCARIRRRRVARQLPARSTIPRSQAMRMVGLDIPPCLCRGGDAGGRRGPAPWPDRHDTRSFGGVRAEPDPRRSRRGRGDRQRECGRRGDPATCEPGGDRQSIHRQEPMDPLPAGTLVRRPARARCG
jgi:hypothetical protein